MPNEERGGKRGGSEGIRSGTAQERAAAPEEGIAERPHSGSNKRGGGPTGSGSMAQSAANGVNQDLASKRLHSR